MSIRLQQFFEESLHMRSILEKIVKNKSYSEYCAAYMLDKDVMHEIEDLLTWMEKTRNENTMDEGVLD